METATPAPAAPAQPATTEISATRDAANRGDFSAFDQAHLSARSGKPLPSVTPTPAPAPASDVTEATETEAPAPAQPPAQVSKRQQQINDYERRIAEQNERIRALEGRTQPPARRAIEEPAAPAPTEPEWKRFAAMPEAPKITEFDSVEDHTAAMALFIADKRYEERQQAEYARATGEQLTEAQRARVEKFVAQLDAAKVSDPEFVNKLTPDVRALRPFAALQPGEAGGPLNVVAEQIYDSPVVDKVLLHLSQHPDELKRLATLPEHLRRLPTGAAIREHTKFIVKEFGRLEARLETSAQAAQEPPVVAPSTISAAPPPPPSIGRTGTTSDPTKTAIARNDFAAFDKAEVAKARAKRGLA